MKKVFTTFNLQLLKSEWTTLIGNPLLTRRYEGRFPEGWGGYYDVLSSQTEVALPYPCISHPNAYVL